MKRRIISIVLLVSLLLELSCIGTAAEENILRAGAGVQAVPGQTVLYPVYMESDVLLSSCKIYLLCDTAVFSAQAEDVGYRVEKGDVTKSGNLFANVYGRAGWQINWYQMGSTRANGVFCYLPLQVAVDAPLGSYEVKLTYSAKDTYDNELEAVSFACLGGSIEVVTTEPTILIEDMEVSTRQQVEIPVQIRNNPGVTGMHLVLEETEQLQLLTDQQGILQVTLETAYSGGSLECYERTPGHWELLWYSNQAVTQEGTMLTLQVQINAALGETITLPLTYMEENTLTTGDQKQAYLLQLGNLIVSEETRYPVAVTNGTGDGEYTAGASVSILADQPAAGMRFKEWGGAEGLTFTSGNAESAAAVFTMPAYGVDLTAVYDRITYLISYEPGAYGMEERTSAQKINGVALTLPGAIFTRTGYAQTGWATEDGGEKRYELNGSYSLDSAVTLYPVWTADTYRIRYEVNHGVIHDAAYAESYTYGVGAALPVEVSRSGYRFDGWYDNEELTGERAVMIADTDMGDKCYWAKWTQISCVAAISCNGTLLEQELLDLRNGSTVVLAGYHDSGKMIFHEAAVVTNGTVSFTVPQTVYELWLFAVNSETWAPLMEKTPIKIS